MHLKRSNPIKFSMLFLFTFVFIIMSYNHIYATGTSQLPHKKYPAVDKKDYGWMKIFKNYKLYVKTNDAAKEFISDDEIRRYLKLKLRGFIKDFGLSEIEKIKDANMLGLSLLLYRYNDTSEIYYGILEINIYPSFDYKEWRPENYRLTFPIAGIEKNAHLKRHVKQIIDVLIKQFSEDYYYIQDLE